MRTICSVAVGFGTWPTSPQPKISPERPQKWPFSQLAVRPRHHEPAQGRLDPVSKWLYLTRAGVLPMTLVSGAVAGLLAVYRGADVAWGWYALAVIGIVGAHMANNLMNDLFDLGVGTDREDYPRNLYSPHPVLSGVITRKGLAGVRARRQLDLPRDHDHADGRAGLADHRVRPRRLPALGRVHRAAAALEEARPRRADGAHRVGSAHGRRHLLRGDRHDPGRGDPRVAALRVALHHGA